MKKLEFTPEDFSHHPEWTRHRWTGEEMAAVANARLAEMLKDAKVVYGDIGSEGSSWTSHKPGTFIQENLSHKALLINIEELVKEPCSHNPYGDTYRGFKCEKCGEPLEAIGWKEATR